MTAWIARNARPIVIVVLVAMAVIGLFEVLDAVVGSSPLASGSAEAELVGVASAAGLLKVLIFLGVGALVARPMRRRFRSAPQ